MPATHFGTPNVRTVAVADPELQFALAEGTMVARQRVIDNLPETGRLFPMVTRTQKLVEDYRRVLQSYSRRLLELTVWCPVPPGNVEALNKTPDFYRYFDATWHAEFPHECGDHTVQHDLVEEVRFPRAHDAFVSRLDALVDMPQGKGELLW